MIEIAVWCIVGIALVGLIVWWATSRRRWMRRHPAPTFVFADLAGYTALTEERGDEAAAVLAREFRRTMCALSREHGAWQVKSMGDGVMIWLPTPGARSRSPGTLSRTSGRALTCCRCGSACTRVPQ